MYTLKQCELEEKEAIAKYTSLVISKDFEDILARAISDDECLSCGDGEVLKHGLCLSCSVRVASPLPQRVLNEYKVMILVKHVGSSK